MSIEAGDPLIQVLNGIGELKAEIVGVAQRIESVALSMAAKVDAHEKRLDDHQLRIGSLETSRHARELKEAQEFGRVEGATNLRKRDLAVIGGGFGIVSTIVGVGVEAAHWLGWL